MTGEALPSPFPRDQRFVTELVAGVTRWRRRLDYVCEALTKQPMAQLDPPMRQILRLALYELLELGIPNHALSVHVDLAKACVRPEAGKFANGERAWCGGAWLCSCL